MSLSPEQVDELLHEPASGAAVHLVGAGGCGMSGLGHLLLDLGFEVTGSDLQSNEEVRQLQARGARIRAGHSADNLEPGTILVVYSSAVRSDNPELTAAGAQRLPVVRRAVLLAALLRRQQGVCVAGMHGKTTTTALLAFALEQLGRKPSYAVGALVPQLTPHARFVRGASDNIQQETFFAVEADESDGTFTEFHPEHALVLNVDAEHLDHFNSMEAVLGAFRRFGDQTRGHLVFCADDPRLAELYARNPRAVSYGRHPLATYRAEVEQASAGETSAPLGRFQVWHQGELLGTFRTRLLGEQNISNATAVIALLHRLGFAPGQIARGIEWFQGAARRQQELYADDRCRVFEDYGHHPNEIRATLRALKALKPNRLLVVFQPHRYTRTQALWKEFSAAFDTADLLWLAELYPASEREIPGINSGFLASAIEAHGKRVEGVAPLSHLGPVLEGALRPGDLLLFLGAGDITKLAHDVVRDLRRRTQGSSAAAPPLEGAADSASAQPVAAMNPATYTQLAALLSSESVLREAEPLARRTTLRVGGKADLYAEPATEHDLANILRFCSARSIPVLVLGRGSNLLIRDGGIRGLVLCLNHPGFSIIAVEQDHLRCGAGARLKAVAVEARRHGLSGLEFLEGIPGSLGGAMRMNAGSMGSWLFDVVDTIRFMDLFGTIQERRASEVNVEYRGCPLFRDHIALGAVLRGSPAAPSAIQAKMESFSRKRWESQPSQPSAGCIFKNPPTVPAGRLIDELGLKGTRVGGAVVSDVHANFIINEGNATAGDVLSLIEIIKARARSARGIELETEVQILGEG